MVLAAWKWGDWRNWQKYYPTILFFALGDLIYSLLTYNFPLWEYKSPLMKTTLIDLVISLIYFPATILLFLPHFPKGFLKQAAYTLLWIIIYIATEAISQKLGFFSHQNGWNIWWSLLFNFLMFPLLYLHHKKPQWAWVVAIAMGTAIIIYFKVPFASMK